jgi:sugar phosphate isomerase/epimerase
MAGLPARGQAIKSSFFVFNNGIRDTAQYKSPEQQVTLAARMGFDGVEKEELDNFAPYYQAMKAKNLKLNAIYVKLDLDNDQQPYDPKLEEVFKLIQGTEALPWFYIVSKKYAPSSPAGDSTAILKIRQVADLAQRYGLKVALYHHMWFWLQTPQDAIRVLEQVNRRNAGMTFNLCHFLAGLHYAGKKAEPAFTQLAAQSLPYLFAVSVNGASFPPADGTRAHIWESLILPLDKGTYHTYRYLKTFWDGGFRGPVGLQCYNVNEAKANHLKRSVQTWEQYKKRYQPGK